MEGLSISLTQTQTYPTVTRIDAQSHWIVLLPPAAKAPQEEFAYLDVLQARRKRAGRKDKTDTDPVVTDLPGNREGTFFILWH